MEIYKSNSNEICYNVKKNTDFIEDKDTDTDTDFNSRYTNFFSQWHSYDEIRELENFIDNKMDSLHKKNIRHDNFHICHQLNLQQKEYIKFQNITIEDLRGELESKQKVIEN